MIELALRATVILVAAWVLTRLMRRATAATRHFVWHSALVVVLFAPLIAPLVPKFALVSNSPPVAALAEALPTPALPVVGDDPQLAPAADARRPLAGVAGLGALVTAGTAACTLWFAIGWLTAARLSRRATPAPAEWQIELNALCDRLRVGREVRLRVVPGPLSPLATGIWSAAILLPTSAVSWTADRRHAVLLHELAHIRRNDCRVQLVVQAACALHWFNPFVWMAASALHAERERACDDLVLRYGARASNYAAHLLDIARELRRSPLPSAALAMARPSELEGRLLAILAEGRARVPARATRWAVTAALFTATVVAFGATATARGGLDAATLPATGAAGVTSPAFSIADELRYASERAVAQRERAVAEYGLQSLSPPEARERAVMALALTSGRDAIPALILALQDADAQVREKAAVGLALRRDSRVVEPLIAALADDHSKVRANAAIALGGSGDPRAAAVLTRALEDADATVRAKAAAALLLLRSSR